MSIFLEGPDLAGKTFWARQIAQWQGCQYVKEPYVPAQAIYAQQVRHIKLHSAVIDRNWYTEVVYADLHKDRQCRLNDQEQWCLALRAMQEGSMTIVLVPSDATLRARYKFRGDGDQSLTTILRAAALYRKIQDAWWVPTEATIIINGPVNSEIMEHALQVVAMYRRTAQQLRRLPASGWGALHRRKILVVGDRLNVKRYRRDMVPLESRRRQTCPGYLYAMLRAAGLGPSDVHIINAFSPSGAPRPGNVIRVLGPRIVLALGERAHAWCNTVMPHFAEASVRLISHPHPAYLRRFWCHFAEDFGYSLGKELGTC